MGFRGRGRCRGGRGFGEGRGYVKQKPFKLFPSVDNELVLWEPKMKEQSPGEMDATTPKYSKSWFDEIVKEVASYLKKVSYNHEMHHGSMPEALPGDNVGFNVKNVAEAFVLPRRPADAKGLFRIIAGNSREEFVRDQLNRGVVPEGIGLHSLAGLIKKKTRESINNRLALVIKSSKYTLGYKTVLKTLHSSKESTPHSGEFKVARSSSPH